MFQGDRTCRACGSADRAAGVVCPDCGPTLGVYSGSEGSFSLICGRCRRAVSAAPGVAPAVSCAACGEQGFGWRNAEGGWSSKPIDELPDQSGRWVRFDFDGIYNGTDRAVPSAVHVAGRRFDVTLLDGTFSNVAYVDAPPSTASSGEIQPIREAKMSGVMVFEQATGTSGSGPGHPGGPFKVTLSDFRLHDWRYVSEEVTIGRSPGIHGRLKGTGYGKLDLKPEEEKRPEDPEQSGRSEQSERLEQADATPLTAQIAQGVASAAEGVSDRIRSALPPSLRSDEVLPRECPVCGRIWLLLIALLFWLLCSWRAALVAGLTLWLACVIHEWFCRRGVGLYAIRRPWRTVITVVLALVFIWFALLALQKAILAAPFAVCGSWAFPGYRHFLILLVLCGLLPARWPRWVVTVLFLWALLASCVSAGRSCLAPAPSSGATAAPSANASAPAGQSSGAPTAPPAPPSPSTLSQQLAQSASSIAGGFVSAIGNLTNQDATADMLAGLPTGGGGLVLASVTQARNDPDRYLACWPSSSGQSGPRYSIYLGHDANFEVDSDRLKPAAAEASLRELLQVFASRPDARFTVTGHTDVTGTDAYNLALSRRRAQAVADWLMAHGIPSSRIDALGVGSSVPLIRPEATLDEGGYLSAASQIALPPEFINRINRRVEVAIDCPPPGVTRGAP